MSWALMLYLYFTLSSVLSTLALALALAAVTYCFLFIIFNDLGTMEGKLKPSYLTYIVVAYIIVLTLNAAIPSTKQAQLIIGAYVAEKATEINGVEKLPENIIGAVNGFLEQLQPAEKAAE